MWSRSARAAASFVLATLVSAALVLPLSGSEPASAAVGGTRFGAVTPKRLLDTREGLGAPQAKVGPAQSISVVVRGGTTTVPSTASAVVLNVTATEPSQATYVTVFPAGQVQPYVSNVNAEAGETAPNLVIVKVGASNSVSFYNNAGAVHLIADVVGFYEENPARAGYRALSPKRLLDSRDGTGGKATPFGQGASYDLQVTGGATTVPAGAVAVVLNVTGTEPSAPTHVTVWPTGVDKPVASNLNLRPGETRPNLVTVKTGTGGKVSLYNDRGSTHLVADVLGYYTTSDAGAWEFVPVDPHRSFDTRVFMPVGAGQEIDFGFTSTPDGAKALVINTTITAPTAPSYFTIYPAGTVRPLASNLNYTAGRTIPNLVITGLDVDGFFTGYNAAGSTHVVFDTNGYFVDP